MLQVGEPDQRGQNFACIGRIDARVCRKQTREVTACTRINAREDDRLQARRPEPQLHVLRHGGHFADRVVLFRGRHRRGEIAAPCLQLHDFAQPESIALTDGARPGFYGRGQIEELEVSQRRDEHRRVFWARRVQLVRPVGVASRLIQPTRRSAEMVCGGVIAVGIVGIKAPGLGECRFRLRVTACIVERAAIVSVHFR